MGIVICICCVRDVIIFGIGWLLFYVPGDDLGISEFESSCQNRGVRIEGLIFLNYKQSH